MPIIKVEHTHTHTHTHTYTHRHTHTYINTASHSGSDRERERETIICRDSHETLVDNINIAFCMKKKNAGSLTVNNKVMNID